MSSSRQQWSLPYLSFPWGWGITIDNDPSWNTRVSGTIGVGTADFDDEKDAREFFRGFLIIEKPPKEISRIGSQPFDITVEIVTTVDFETTRRVLLKKEDFLIRKR